LRSGREDLVFTACKQAEVTQTRDFCSKPPPHVVDNGWGPFGVMVEGLMAVRLPFPDDVSLPCAPLLPRAEALISIGAPAEIDNIGSEISLAG
jgi:hypothetical protein